MYGLTALTVLCKAPCDQNVSCASVQDQTKHTEVINNLAYRISVTQYLTWHILHMRRFFLTMVQS